MGLPKKKQKKRLYPQKRIRLTLLLKYIGRQNT